MRTLRSFLVVAALLTCVLSSGAARAQALDCAPSQLSLRGFDVLPLDGTTAVPTNATPFVSGVDLELRLLGPDGEIASTIEDMIVVGSFGAQSSLRRLVPAGDLSPGQTITIEADGQLRSTFTVADTRDDAAPDQPGATVDEVAAGETSACGPLQSSVTIGLQVPVDGVGDAAFFIGAINGQPTVGAGIRVDGASSTDQLVLFTEGAVEVNVAAVDLAGNVSASVPLNVEVPQVALCQCTRSSRGTIGYALLGLAFLVRTRSLRGRRTRAR